MLNYAFSGIILHCPVLALRVAFPSKTKVCTRLRGEKTEREKTERERPREKEERERGETERERERCGV